MVSSQDVDGDHTRNLIVEMVNFDDQYVFYGAGDCIDPFLTGSPSPFLARYVDQIIYSTPPGEYCPTGGDSGSPILDFFGHIIGMLQYGADAIGCPSGGTDAATIREVAGFDHWYGDSYIDNTFGVWRIHSTLGTGFWSLDNGDGRWNGCVWGSTQTTEDKDLCLQVGLPGDQPITGDWLNTAIKQIGIVRPSTGLVYQDLNHNGWDGCGPDHCTTFVEMEAEDLAVAGDWDGNGTAAVGIWNPFTGFWRLDNGNGVWNECGGFPAGDACGTFGGDGDQPIVWNQSVIKAN